MQEDDRKKEGHKKRFETLQKRYGKDYMSSLIKRRWEKDKVTLTTNLTAEMHQ